VDVSSNEEAREQLRNLNPRQDTPLPDLPEAAPRVIIAADETFRKTIKKFVINGSSPSGSGWTGDHLTPLLKDQDCLRVLALLATLIRNGELDDTCRSHLLGNPLYALQKPAGGTRPIVPAEPFYKMAAATAIETSIDEVTDLLGLFQLGVGGKGGPEAAAWLLRVMAQDSALLALDFKNAFNSLDRAEMLRELFTHPRLATMWRMVHWSYKEPTPLWIFGPDRRITEAIMSGRGCRQGDPFAPILFAIAVKRIYDHMMGVGGPETHGVAILDDATVAGPLENLLQCAEDLRDGGNTLGLELRWVKCKLLWQHQAENQMPADLRARFEALGVPIYFGTTKLLGTPIGPDDEVHDILLEDVADYRTFF
jgi:hypothetical protein